MMNFNSNTHSGSLLNRLKVRGDIREDKETNLIKSDVNKGSSSIHSYRKHLTRSDKKNVTSLAIETYKLFHYRRSVTCDTAMKERSRLFESKD